MRRLLKHCRPVLAPIVATGLSIAAEPEAASLSIHPANDDEGHFVFELAGESSDVWTLQSSFDLLNWEAFGSDSAMTLNAQGLAFFDYSSLESPTIFLRAFKEIADVPENGLPTPYGLFSDSLTMYVDGDYMVIESDNIPNHPSPYFPANDSQYENYNGSNAQYRKNPNEIAAQNMVYRIPLNPEEANNKQNTRLGSIGIAINGVAFFNQYAGPNQPLTNEINSFDQYNGHPTGTDTYHYHVEPLYLTGLEGKDGLIGVLLDGFPVYGPYDDGLEVNPEDLDEYHGHNHATPEFPDGIYHYHFSDQDPYLNGGQYFGTPGTQTN